MHQITGYFYRKSIPTGQNAAKTGYLGQNLSSTAEDKNTWDWEYGQFSVTADGRLGEFQVLPKPAANEETLWYLPGLCDVHAHLQISGHGQWAETSEMINAGKEHLKHGVLAIRDCGGKEIYPSQIRSHPEVPRIIHCGRHLAAPKRYLRGLPLEVSAAELPEALVYQARRSDGWVKIVGDWIDRSQQAEADLSPLWPRSALIEGIAAAHEAGARVTAHVFGQAALPDLIEAGVDCLEHATGLSEDQAKDLARKGIPVTPTLMQVELFADFARQAGNKYPVYAQTMQKLYDQRVEHFQMLIASGVQLLPGTDSGGYQKPGSLGQELDWWVKYAPNLDSKKIINWASVQCREFFGWGDLSPGQPADLLGYATCPTKQENTVIAQFLTRPEKICYRGYWHK